VSRIIDEHRLYLRDRSRVSAYERALRDIVTPGDTVCDLASGTGILGMLACRAGASRVYAIEETAIAGLAREIAKTNGLDGTIISVRGHSRSVTLPERADVIVCDQVGGFGLESDIVELFRDARARFLRVGGTVIPRRLELVVAAIEHPRLRRRLEFWNSRPAGFDFSPAANIAANTGYPIRLRPDHLLSSPAVGATIDLTADVELPVHVSATVPVTREGVLHGVGGWFVAHLSPNVTMTNSPLSADRIYRRPIFFPIERGVPVKPGTSIDVAMRVLPSEAMYAWEVSVEEARFHHTTLRGMLLAREDLVRTHPGYVPKLTRAGQARMTVLQLADGHRTLEEIERSAYERHEDFFASPAQAALFVAEVVTRYG
jgi:Arginine methyltransferase oligomerization subdomain/Ribosomal protein L11 methyltransferase (PrmA)